MTTIMRIGESLIKMNGWKVTRFDIQAIYSNNTINGYIGYISVIGKNNNSNKR